MDALEAAEQFLNVTLQYHTMPVMTNIDSILKKHICNNQNTSIYLVQSVPYIRLFLYKDLKWSCPIVCSNDLQLTLLISFILLKLLLYSLSNLNCCYTLKV